MRRPNVYRKLKIRSKKNVFFGVFVAGFISFSAFILSFFYYNASFQVSSFLGILSFLIVLWTNNALPLGVVSLLPIILFPAFGILDVKSATSNYANPIIFLFLGGFMVSAWYL